MFDRWFKPKAKACAEHKEPLAPPDVPGIMIVKSIDVLLEQHTSRIAQINELAGLSNTNFDRFYLSAIQNYARFVQQLPASEVHHHAGLGGMLTHALEVSVFALKVRRSYLLSQTGEAEEIAQKQDLWTYAVFIAALCHDLAKVAVDQVLTIYDENHQQQKWEPWNQFIDEQGQWYTSEFVHNRQYRLHEKATPLLINKIIPTHGMKWISSDQVIFSNWLACLSGDSDNASSIGEIVSIADSKSVAENLGADNSRMPTVKTKPLHEKMLTALRHLLIVGELPLNRNGAAGWVKGDDCWLVSKRTVDAIRDQLTQEGHTGIPTKNGRLFDILQEHAVIIPYGEKAIWSATIEGEGWSHDLTLIKVATNKIWTNPAQRPNDFEGNIVVAAIKSPENNDESTLKTAGLEGELQEKNADFNSNERSQSSEGMKVDNTLPEKVEYKSPEPIRQNSPTTVEDDLDLLAFLPSINIEQEQKSNDKKDDDIKTDEVVDSFVETNNIKNVVQPDGEIITHKKTSLAEKQNNSTAQNKRTVETDQVTQFFEWLQDGIKKGSLKTNQAKARIHTVDEGVILITPGIFQDFARTKDEENYDWTTIQQKVLKKNWHVRNSKGLNVVKYQVKGKNKQTTMNAVLFNDVRNVFGCKEPPASNPHLTKMD